MEGYKRKKTLRNLVVLVLAFAGVTSLYFMTHENGSFKDMLGLQPVTGGTQNKTEIETKEVEQIYFSGLSQGNYIVGDEIPEGVFWMSINQGKERFCLWEAGMLVKEWSIDVADETKGTYRDLSLTSGQILQVIGPAEVLLQSQETMSYTEKNKSVVSERYQLAQGTYEIGKDLVEGIATFMTIGEDTVTVITMTPAEGGINHTFSADRNLDSGVYRGVQLKKGEVLTVSGGEIIVHVEK